MGSVILRAKNLFLGSVGLMIGMVVWFHFLEIICDFWHGFVLLDIPLQLFPKSNPLSLTALDGASGSQPSSSSSSSLIGGTTLSSSASGSDETDDQPGTSKAPYSSYRRTE